MNVRALGERPPLPLAPLAIDDAPPYLVGQPCEPRRWPCSRQPPLLQTTDPGDTALPPNCSITKRQSWQPVVARPAVELGQIMQPRPAPVLPGGLIALSAVTGLTVVATMRTYNSAKSLMLLSVQAVSCWPW